MKAKTWKMEGSDPPLVANVAWAMNGQWTASSDFSARDAQVSRFTSRQRSRSKVIEARFPNPQNWRNKILLRQGWRGGWTMSITARSLDTMSGAMGKNGE